MQKLSFRLTPLTTTIVEQKDYCANAACVDVSGVLINPLNGVRIPFKTLCTIDTGFSDGVFLPAMYIQKIEETGAKLPVVS
jgi:hypothetical protein